MKLDAVAIWRTHRRRHNGRDGSPPVAGSRWRSAPDSRLGQLLAMRSQVPDTMADVRDSLDGEIRRLAVRLDTPPQPSTAPIDAGERANTPCKPAEIDIDELNPKLTAPWWPSAILGVLWLASASLSSQRKDRCGSESRVWRQPRYGPGDARRR